MLHWHHKKENNKGFGTAECALFNVALHVRWWCGDIKIYKHTIVEDVFILCVDIDYLQATVPFNLFSRKENGSCESMNEELERTHLFTDIKKENTPLPNVLWFFFFMCL